MKTNDLVNGGYYRIHDSYDIVVRYDIESNTFKSRYYTYRMGVICGKVCALDKDRHIVVHPIHLNIDTLLKNGFTESEIKRDEFNDVGLRYLYETDDGSYVIVDWQDSFENGCANELHIGWNEAWFLTVDKDGVFESNIRDRIYIHELQRILQTCGLYDLSDNLKIQSR